MDLYQDLVGRHLQRDPAVFLHHDITIRLEGAAKGNRWVIDLLAVHLKEQRACLCELELSRDLGRLIRRLRRWDEHWSEIHAVISATTGIPATWPFEVRLFLPSHHQGSEQLDRLALQQMPTPRITWLETVAPWASASKATTSAECRPRVETPQPTPSSR